MSEPLPFQYSIIRVVPHEARGEFINAGIILYCSDRRFLDARLALDEKRLLALAPQADLEHVRQHLAAIPKICAGGAVAGALGELSLAERFRWLTAPRNTILQTSPVHSGLTDAPAQTLEELVTMLVRPPR